MISFCDRELDLLGKIEGRDVLYAGGTSPLWIEGLSDRIGANGSLAILDTDSEALESAHDFFAPEDLPLIPRFVAGDVFLPPLPRSSFDVVYSSGLFHELDVSRRPATAAISAMSGLLRPGGRLATSDFVDDVAAAQLEDEAIEATAANVLHGAKPYGIAGSRRLFDLHEGVLDLVTESVYAPYDLRHLDKLFVAGGVPDVIASAGLAGRWHLLSDRIVQEGYTRPATMFIQGFAKRNPEHDSPAV